MATRKRKSTSNYEIPFAGEKRKSVHRVINAQLKQGKSPQQIYESLKSKNLGYRKQNVLADIRLKNATRNAKTPQARKNAESWFKNVFEPFREKYKLDSKRAKKLYDKAVDESYKTKTDASRGKELRKLYSSRFKRVMKRDYGENPDE